jgi:serine/threonine-protein kinase
VNSEIPDWLAEVVERLHAKDPAERFSTAAEVAEVLTYHLAELQRTGTSSSLRPTPSEPLPKAPGRKRAAAATVLTLAVLGASAVSGMPGRIFALLPPGDDRVPKLARSAAAGSGGHVVVQDAGGKSLENPIIGSGRPSVKVWDVADFNAVKIGSTFRAEITRGDRFKVTTSSDDNVVEHIQVVKEGKTLRIGLEQGIYRLNEPLKAVITLPTLEALDVSGASRATLKGFRSQGDFKLNLSGASTLDGETEVGDADFLVSGASTLALSGTARASHVWVSGASHLKLPEFLMKQCEIGLSGASTVVLSVRSEQPFWATLSGASTLAGTVDAGDFELELEGASRATLGGSAKDAKVKADGASHVDMLKLSVDARTVTVTVGSASTVALQGKAEAATIVASDSGTLRLADLAVDDADVKLSGVSRAAVRVRKRLKYDLSAQSRLDYSGNPPTLLGSKSKEATLRPRP